MSFTYKVETFYDSRIPQTAVPGFAPRGLAMHWTAGGTGRAGALGTRSFFMNTAATRNASYHVLVYWENRVFGVMWIVDPRVAAHSLAPKPVSAGGSYNPNAEVRRILGTKVNDPNAGCLAISFCGMPADLEAALRDPDFVDGYYQLYKDLLVIPSLVDRPLFNHGWAQPTTRSDAGSKLIPLLYGETPTQGVDDMLFWKPVQQDWWTANGTVFYDGNGARKVFVSRERVRSVAEDSTGRWRLVRYGGGEYLVVDARGSLKEGPGLEPISGTRIPTTDFGFAPAETVTVVKEVPTGITEAQVQARLEAARADAVEQERDRLVELLGL